MAEPVNGGDLGDGRSVGGGGVRRRSSRGRSGSRGKTAIPRETIRRGLFYAMIGVTLAYGGWCFKQVHQTRWGFSDLWLGASRDDTRYGFGPPAEVGEATGPLRAVNGSENVEGFRRWGYRTREGGHLVVGFSETGSVQSLSCEATTEGGSCYPVLGVDIGTDEISAMMRLGWPDRQAFAGDTKLIYYDDIGLELAMQRFRVSRITANANRRSLLDSAGFWAGYVLP